jgi:hypothetical protein
MVYLLRGNDAASGLAPFAQRVLGYVTVADAPPFVAVPLAGLRVAAVAFVLASAMLQFLWNAALYLATV